MELFNINKKNFLRKNLRGIDQHGLHKFGLQVLRPLF